MATGTIGEYRGDPAERDGASVSPRRPVLVHHLVAKHGDKGLEVLRILLDERGETLPVFSAGWAARGYLFAEAPGGGWYVKTCTPGELFSLLVGPCAGVEWVALDPRPGPRRGGEVANVMPRENFVDYLLGLTRPLAAPRELVRGCLETAKQELGQLAEPCGASASRRVRANGDAQSR